MGLLGTSPVLVGRAAELGALRAVFASGANGVPRVALVSGEAGIGKTRLVTEFLDEIATAVQSPPVIVAVGQCVDLGDIGAPFTPVRRMLRELYVAVGDEEFREAAGTPLVVRTLGTLVPELSPDREPTPGPAPDFITEAVERVIIGLSATRHLVLVFEDLHWADSATLALLKALSITLRAAHVTALMTYRSDDVGRGHPLRPLLADLDRSRAVARVPVSRLDATEAALIARSVGDGIDEKVAAVIAARSEGVPFFIEELVDLDADTPPLGTLRDVVLARFERLSPVATRVVGTVAAGGVHADDGLLAEVYDGDRVDLRAGLHEAIDANILVADGDGYRFRHALIQEAVHEDLLPSERAELHARYAGALDQRVAAGHRDEAAALAEHWLRARDIPNAFDATIVARRYASETLAPITAAKLGERLLELWPQVPNAATKAGLSRAELSLEVAEDYSTVDERGRSLRIAEAGLGFAEPEERLLRVRLLIEIANGQRGIDAWDRVPATYRAARELLDEDGGPEDLALLARVDPWFAWTDVSLRTVGLEMIDRAVGFGERSGDATALATALERRAYWVGATGDWPRAVDDMRRAAALPTSGLTRMIVATNLLDLLSKVGAYDEGIEFGRRAFEEAAASGYERGQGGFLLGNLCELEGLRGDVEPAIADGERSLMLLQSSFFVRYVETQLATFAAWDERLELRRHHRAHMDAIEHDPDDIGDLVRTTFLDAVTAFSEVGPTARIPGSAEFAERVAAILRFRALGLPDLELPGDTEPILPLAGWLSATDPDARSILLRDIEHALGIPDAGPHSAALKAVARAFLDGGVPAWREALRRAEEGRIPHWYVPLARLQLADALLALGERDEASLHLDQVIAEAPRRGASLVARWARELAERAGFSTPDAMRHQEGKTALTARELQVLALVAEGLTNPQIGQRLFISPKTASVHVSAILAKIGATNRAEAAAWYATASV